MNGAADATVARDTELRGDARADGAPRAVAFGEGPAHRGARTPVGAEPAGRQATGGALLEGIGQGQPVAARKKARDAVRPTGDTAGSRQGRLAHRRGVPPFLSP